MPSIVRQARNRAGRRSSSPANTSAATSGGGKVIPTGKKSDALKALDRLMMVSVNMGSTFGPPTEPGVLDPDRYRLWSRKNTASFASIRLRKKQISGAKRAFVPKDTKVPQPALDATLARCEDMQTVLEAPNPLAENNTFASMVDKFIDDHLTLALGALVPGYRANGQIYAMINLDAAMIDYVRGWRSPADGPRYVVKSPFTRDTVNLYDHQLFTMVMNPVTYSPRGIPPLQVLEDKLQAEVDSFATAWGVQKQRTPGGIVNFPGMTRAEIIRMKQWVEQERMGNSVVRMINYKPVDPEDKMDYIQIGNVNLHDQLMDWFYTTVMTLVCQVFEVSPFSIGWQHDSHYNTAAEANQTTLDKGVKPIMRDFGDLLNTRFVPCWGDPNITFVWPDLITTDDTEDAEILRQHAGAKREYWTINDLRAAAGLKRFDYRDPMMQALVDQVLFEQPNGPPLPLEVLAKQCGDMMTMQMDPNGQLSLGGQPINAAPPDQQAISGRNGNQANGAHAPEHAGNAAPERNGHV